MSNSPPYTDATGGTHTDQKADESLDNLATEEFLRVIGSRVRAQRSKMSMSRKRLAEVSGVSERYLAQLESGQGNMSIALLRNVTRAIDMPLAELLASEASTDQTFQGKPSLSTQRKGIIQSMAYSASSAD